MVLISYQSNSEMSFEPKLAK